MKVLAFTVLHYGKEYLKASIDSVKDSVDKHYIVYTPFPSFGSDTDMINPDTKQELQEICEPYDHIVWEDINNVKREHQHRECGLNYAMKNSYDIVLVVDSDEIWEPSKVKEAIEYAYRSKNGQFCVMGSQWITLWKDFNRYVTDGFAPVRLFNMHNDITKAEHIDKGFIYHMGYCISDQLMEYKISCHGHRTDFVKNNTWFKNKWLGYNEHTRFLHPATDAYWQEAKPFDKNTLPDVLKSHPNFNK